jgi:hypothetical protein
MDTWMVSGTTLKTSHVNFQVPSFGKINGYSFREGPLGKWIKEQ